MPYVATECIEGYKLFSPLGQSFMASMAAATGAVELPGQVFTNPWFEKIIARASTLNRRVIFRNVSTVLRTGSKAVKLYRTGAFVTATVLVADDVTVVGVADDGIAAGLLVTIGVSYVVDGAVTVLANAADKLAGPDVGPTPEGVANDGKYADSEPLTGAAYEEAAGAFALTPKCQDESQIRNNQRIVEEPNSNNLNRNLKEAGCECPDDSNAHHLSPVKQRGMNFDRVRDILRENNIDLDDAANGVCLPTKDNAEKTGAFRHQAGGPLHNDKLAGMAIRKRLEMVLARTQPGPARTAALRQELREIAKDATYGRKFF